MLTSNAEHDNIGKLLDQFEDAAELSKAVRSVLRDSGTFRPEIVSRFDQIYVFKPLEGVVNAEIAALKIKKAAEEYGVIVDHIAPEIVFEIMQAGDDAQDTRELTRIVDGKLGELFLKAREQEWARVRVVLDASNSPAIEPSA